MGSNEAQAGGGALAAKTKRGNPSPGQGPEPTPGAGTTPGAGQTPGPDKGFEGMVGPKGRWMFTPPESAKVSHRNSQSSFLSNDPTITSAGGPDSEVVSSDSQSGHWILKPFGSLESVDGLGKLQHPSVSGLTGTHESTLRKISRKKRPCAPKPHVHRRSLMRNDSLLATGAGPRAFRSAPGPHAASETEPRDALAISSAINLAWKEAWDLPPVGPDPTPPTKAKDEAADRKSKSKEAASAKGSPPPTPVPRLEEAKPPSPVPAKETGSDRGKEPEKDSGTVYVSKKPKSDQPPPEGKTIPFSEVAAPAYCEEGPIVVPRSMPPCVKKKGLLASDVCPAGVCDERKDKQPQAKYCPWHPHASFDAWGPRRPKFPGWLSVEEEEKISRLIGRERGIPCSPRKKFADAATTCCMDTLPPKKTKVKTTKVVGGTKKIRPEIRRWLAGYPQITRFRRETQDLIRNAPEGMSAEIDETNERHIFVDILGPDQSLYEGGLFRVEVFFPAEYPRTAPQIRFMTKIYHPNVDKLGRIRLPDIEEKWRSGRLLREALGSVRALLANPNVAEPIAVDVARRWYWQGSSAQQTARLWTRKFAHRHSAAAWLDCRCDCCCERLAAVSVFV